ncbi:bacillithiol biosynthesis deacetylase BshB2 [Evansella sp. LMS18]|jgi:bacillithiol biosynthesis deacetylase BshB2|uniref:bacillithiol biosynthesis deacetylase BshB2 n=1 Tax=Evansella sp. LMS18 TaxID=2924033 RepID=UPI0020D06527|nr:bacillithiol biosynthesis deacetylase BshB2 [Evansella sp. LMS18]UTR12275.1 bacillithiol biosynthesis deacetylase BshB2 [Evansella sp. LMS18]
MERHVLVIFPHPDDEAFGVAGTIISHTDAGTPVTYVCLTLGEMGRNMGKPIIANRETLPEIRKKELEEACRHLGIEDLRRFGMRDKTVEFADQDALVSQIYEVIQETDPSLIITFFPGYAVHPDHNATGAAVIQAVQRLPVEARPVVHAIAFSEGCEDVLGPPDVVRDVKHVAERKFKVIEAHASQTSGVIEVMKERFLEADETVEGYMLKERFWTFPVNSDKPEK